MAEDMDMNMMKINQGKKKDEQLEEICDAKQLNKLYSKSCGNNKQQLRIELDNREELASTPDETPYLYPILDDPNFNIKIAQKEEFYDTKYDGSIHDVEEYANVLSAAEYELLPQQAFVRNFLSLQTPYNSLLLFHGLGSGKTCSAIGVCEEMRDYLQQMGISKHIIIVASPNVQDNFKLQLFDERKLKEVDGIWTMKGCLGNKLLKEINPTSMKGLKREKVIQQVKNLINASYSFRGYLQFSNEIAKVADPSANTNTRMEQKIFNLQQAYSDSLIVIDEVHNIRISDDNENKNVAKNLMFLVSVVSNLRLLLLSATPMFNSYKEIVWLLNLMNMNDRRGIVTTSDIFDKNGKFKVDSEGNEIGKEIFIRKATGYVSHVRGENPYTFPFRVYPNRFSPANTFNNAAEYPNYQINGKLIPKDKKIEKLSLYLTAIGEYQRMGYNYIVDRLRNRGDFTSINRQGRERKRPTFSNLKSFGYTDLQIPIEALNIVYPIFGLERLMGTIQPFIKEQEQEQDEEDLEKALSPIVSEEKEIVEEIDDAIENGPQLSEIGHEPKSELESEPVISEGVEGVEDIENAESNLLKQMTETGTIEEKQELVLPKTPKKKKNTQIEFEISDKDIEIIELKKELKECEHRLEMVQEEQIIPKKRAKAPKAPRSKKQIEPSVALATQSSTLYKQPLEAKKSPSIPITTGLHIVEGETHTNLPTEYNDVVSHETPKMKTNTNTFLGGYKTDEHQDPDDILDIDPKDLTGGHGLKRIMNFIDSKTPSIKGQFEYKRGVPHVFNKDEIGKYSAKIKSVCEYIYSDKGTVATKVSEGTKGTVANGIILIYSSYIDAGIIPMALALEEMGFTRYGEKAQPLFKTPPTPVVDVRTMRPPTNKKDFKPARYVMITGDTRISPNNDADVKAITSNDNIFEKDKDGNTVDISGEKIKVVLISQAGSEGLDFKAIRQVHILEPWYNVNRIEQIIGRAVRNFSHKELPFSQRNVQIFLHGTILENSEEEAADLYVYRISELKAVKIGKVTRLLKQTAVDCIINHDQTQFTTENFNKIEANMDIYQVLSDHQRLDHFAIGDMNDTPTCDFMECEFKCIPDAEIDESMLNTDTYNETFMLINSDKIIQKIKLLMKLRYFYKKDDLIRLLNTPKKYPIAQIYAALTQIIGDNTEYITDRYGRTGYLVNIGDYYLFQPSELNNNHISVYERSVPIDYKNKVINFKFKNNIGPQAANTSLDKVLAIDNAKGQQILDEMFTNYNMALDTVKVERGKDNWYGYCGVVMRKMASEGGIIQAPSEQDRIKILDQYLIEHIVDGLMMEEKVDFLNFIYQNKQLAASFVNPRQTHFFAKAKAYLLNKFIAAKGLTGIVMFNGPSRVDNLHIYVLDGDIWHAATSEDKRDLEPAILKKYRLKTNLNQYVGFIGFETNKKYMIFKIKDTTNERSTGFRCDQSGKEKIVKILNEIETTDKYESKATKESSFELCVRQELTMRGFESRQLNNLSWFLDTETAIINEFEKKQKK